MSFWWGHPFFQKHAISFMSLEVEAVGAALLDILKRKTNTKGGSSAWRAALTTTMRLVNDQLQDDVDPSMRRIRLWILRELRMASQHFFGNTLSSWRPFVLVCIRLLGLPPVEGYSPSVCRVWLGFGADRLAKAFPDDCQPNDSPDVAPAHQEDDGHCSSASPEQSCKRPRKSSAAPTTQEKELYRILEASTPEEVLDVPPGAAIDVLRRRYFMVAKLIHPDKFDHPLATQAFQKVGSALDTLNVH